MTIDARIETRRAQLTKARAERLDPLDYPRTWTQRQVNVYEAETTILDQQIADLNTRVAVLAALSFPEPDEKWRDFLTSSRGTLNAELLAIRTPIRDDATRERARALGWSIDLIDRGWAANRVPAPIIDLSSTRIGELMITAGYDVVGLERLRGPNGFRGSLPEVEQRLKDLMRKRAAAQAALDAVLMDDIERAKADAEGQAHRDTLNRLYLRIGTDGYIVCDEYGDVRDPATLTPAERTAFERADGAYRQEQQEHLDRALGRG